MSCRALIGLVAAAAVMAATPAARAEDGDDPGPGPHVPLPRWSYGLVVAGGAATLGPLTVGGAGVDLEVLRGRGRWQAYGELHGMRTGGAGKNQDVDLTGWRTRVGAGARWLARSFHPDHSAGIEMYLEGGVGVERYWWDGGGHLSRPDVSFGWGVHVRGFRPPRFMVRVGVQVMVAPMPADATRALCRGTCTVAGAAPADTGFITQLGVSWW